MIDFGDETTSEDERMTRLAALALCRQVEDWTWSTDQRCLFHTGEDGRINYATFAPLTNPAHAYEMEDALEIEVQYLHVKRGDGSLTTTIRVNDKSNGGAIYRTQREGETSLQVRMYAVTNYAALRALMDLGDMASGALMRAAGK